MEVGAFEINNEQRGQDKEQAWWTSEQGMIQKGRELGTEPRPGENWDQFKARLTTTMRNKQGVM